MHNTLTKISVPKMLYRAGTSQMDADGNTVRLSISSNTPYLRYDALAREEYWEVLSHDAGEVDLSRLENGASLLFNHDKSIQLGTITKPQIQGGKCYVEARLSEAPDVESYRIRMKERILKDTSVGYEVESEGEVIGKKDGVPIIKFRWFPMEASMCTVAADITVGIGRTRDTDGGSKEISIRSKNKNIMNTPEENPNENASKLTHTQQLEHGEKMRQFAKALHSPEWRRIGLEHAERAALAGLKFEEFRQRLNEQLSNNVFVDEPDGESERAHGVDRGFGRGDQRSIGAMVLESKEVRAFKEGGKKTISLSFPHVRNVRAHAGTRAINASAAFGATVQHIGAPTYSLQRPTIADLIAAGSTSASTVRYPRENSFTSTVDTVGEAGLKPEQDFDVTPEDAAVKKIAGWFSMTSELLEDMPAAESYFSSRLVNAIELKEETQILRGDGMGNNIKGIFSTAGIQTQAYSSSKQDTIRKAITAIAVNTDYMATGIVIHPTDWEAIELTRLPAADGPYLIGSVVIPGEVGGQKVAPTLWGLPVVVTKAAQVGVAYVGDWARGAEFFRRTGLHIEMSNQHADFFVRNLVAVLAEERGALAVFAPAAFVEADLTA